MGIITTPTQEQLASLPIFPLSGVVFFPNTLLPLHIFEPRYREMTAYCIENNCPLAMVMIAPGFEEEQIGKPPVLPIGCVGDVIHHEKLPDGRYQIVLRGLSRISILEERDEPEKMFRTVRASLLEDVVPDDVTDLNETMGSIRACLTALGYQRPEVAEPLSRLSRYTDDPAVLTDVWGAALFVDVAERQELLASLNVEARAQQVLDRLTELMVGGMEGGTLH